MESGKFTRERIGEHLPALYPVMGYKRGAVAYFIPKVFQNLIVEISFQHHAFFLVTNHYWGADSKN